MLTPVESGPCMVIQRSKISYQLLWPACHAVHLHGRMKVFVLKDSMVGLDALDFIVIAVISTWGMLSRYLKHHVVHYQQ